jgi:hypothetical protein
MKLVGVLSCRKEYAHRNIIRDTWGKEVKLPWKLLFFVGTRLDSPEEDPEIVKILGTPGTLAVMHPTKLDKPSAPEKDEPDVIKLDTYDTYLGTSFKGKAIQRYAYEHNYEGLFLAMCDTLVFPDRLNKACVGHTAGQVFKASSAHGYPHPVACPHGGYGYWLDREVLGKLYNEPVLHYSEDQSTAFGLHKNGIMMQNSRSFAGASPQIGYITYGCVSNHLSSKFFEFKPEDISNAWEASKVQKAKFPTWDGICPRCKGVLFRPGLYGPRCQGCGNHYRMPSLRQVGAMAGKTSVSGRTRFIA